MSEQELVDGEEARPLPYPLPVASGIRWARTLPPELEDVSAELARIEVAPAWFELDASRARSRAWVAITSANTADSRLGEIAGLIYMAWRDLASPDQRAFFIDLVAAEVWEGRCAPCSLAALAALENDPLLIARAAAAYAFIQSIIDSEAMPVAEELLTGWREADPEHRTGIFLGLMITGQPEVLEELRGYRYELTDDEVSMACEADISGGYDTTGDFILEWLEELQAEGDRGKFGMLAAAFRPREDDESAAEGLDWRRLSPPEPETEIPDTWYFPITTRVMGRHLAPRLRTLARREAGTRVMPAVLEAFGLDSEEEAS